MIEYPTNSGVRLRVGRVSRHVIDGFVAGHPEPEPLTVTMMVFGDVEEEVPDYYDPAYQAQRHAWLASFGTELFDLLIEVVEIPEDIVETRTEEMQELKALGLDAGDGRAALLRYSILSNEREMADVVELVLYNSTVTVRGMEEAANLFNVTWMGQRIPVISSARGRATVSQLFGDRQAAQWAGYKWYEFCELPGPEQSAIVAHHRLTMRLEALEMQR